MSAGSVNSSRPAGPNIPAILGEGPILMCVDLLVDALGHTDASGGSDRLQWRCDVHAIAIDAVVLHDHVAKMDADPGLDPFVRPRLALATACASWIACAQRTALTTVSNSPNTESPAVSTTRPW